MDILSCISWLGIFRVSWLRFPFHVYRGLWFPFLVLRVYRGLSIPSRIFRGLFIPFHVFRVYVYPFVSYVVYIIPFVFFASFVSFVVNGFPFRLPEPIQRRKMNHEKHEKPRPRA